MPKNVFPFDMNGIEDVSLYLRLITQYEPDIMRRARTIHDVAGTFNLENAASCGVYQQARNIQNAEQQMLNYLSMAFFTAAQIEGDIEQIRNVHKAAQREYTRRQIAMQAEAAAELRRKKERERIAEKRAADKAALQQ